MSQPPASLPERSPIEWPPRRDLVHMAAREALSYLLGVDRSKDPVPGVVTTYLATLVLIPWEVGQKVLIGFAPLNLRRGGHVMRDESGRPIVAALEGWKCVPVLGRDGLIVTIGQRSHTLRLVVVD